MQTFILLQYNGFKTKANLDWSNFKYLSTYVSWKQIAQVARYYKAITYMHASYFFFCGANGNPSESAHIPENVLSPIFIVVVSFLHYTFYHFLIHKERTGCKLMTEDYKQTFFFLGPSSYSREKLLATLCGI